jgi:hypothetical protein
MQKKKKAFSNSFDFCGLHLSDALRKFLDAFRLPGQHYFTTAFTTAG